MRVEAHHLSYELESLIAERLRSLKVPRAKYIAESLTPQLMDKIPPEAFEMQPIWERGLIHYHGDVTEESALAMQDELMAIHCNIKPALPITLYLSSFGGSCESGMAFFSTIQEIRRAGRTVNCHIQGMAMSMGSILAQACDMRTIEPYAVMMLHGLSDGYFGKNEDVRDRLEFNEQYDRMLNGIFAQRSGKPIEYWMEKQRRRDWFLTARQAVAEGLVDKIRPIKPFAIKKKKPQESAP